MDKAGNLVAALEPADSGELLPHSQRSVGREEQADSSHTHLRALLKIAGQGIENRMDLHIFKKFKSERYQLYSMVKTCLLRSEVNDAVERKNGTGPFGSVIEATRSADVRQQDGDDLFETKGAESRKSDDAISRAFAGFQLLNQQRQELVDDDGVLLVAQISKLRSEALGADDVTASGMEQISNRHQSGLLQVLGGLDGAGLVQVLQNQ